ncbi:hypothetical protein SAMN06297144_0030 [Sphingomonas guangdongensis]|uniref:TraB family protein n=1 Tax=Sphingomonas guangdongensis TaxID=1141890 RepID=A0A285Q9A7_9SPHN|nr:TraB/GumN family protein [Sphingomonas guangdongensis]SOB78525.1 hypothetical protein SAMN06297144_0030 [Sphingomonas guangdongensis]
MKTLMKTAASALALLFVLPACAQQAPAPAPAAQDADPALWVVKDADTTVYLFGTVHVLKPGLSWFDEAVKTAFDKSDTLVLEMVEPEPAAMQQLVMAKAMNPAGPTLTEQIPEAKRPAYLKAMADNGIPPAAFDRMKPWLAAVTLSVLPLKKLGYDPETGAEKVLTGAAKTAGKKIDAVETAEQQLGFFDSLTPAAQVEFLTSTVDELPKLGETMGTMIADWSEGDPDSLAVLLNESMKESPEVAKTLLYDRNARWADWIVKRMEQPGTVFFAVGAGHLAGDRSVIADLKARKLTAERVKY